MPSDIWIPALKGLYPLKSDQLNVGIAYNWHDVALISMEVYRKWLYHTTDFKNGASLFSDLAPWYEKTTQGRGDSRGIELSIEKQEGRLFGSINYTFSKADRQYREINNGKKFPFKYDRLNDINITLNYTISKQWELSALWCFGSGYPITVPIEKYYPALNIVSGIQHNLIYFYPSLNNYRLPAYHRLDLSARYRTQNRFGEQILSFDIFNVYNRRNPLNMYFLLNYSFKYVYLFPIIPTITYTLKFSNLTSSAKRPIN
jgi:hypothetical protein